MLTARWSIGTGLELLNLANANFLRDMLSEESIDFATHEMSFEAAVEEVRSAGRRDFVPYALIAQARFWCAVLRQEKGKNQEQYLELATRIRARLEEARDIAMAVEAEMFGTMKLNLADCYIATTWHDLITGNDENAVNHFRLASELVQETKYFRRKRELELLEQRLSERLPNEH